jgi:murein DD-endopeptidase MepM/ murein hydrolase activator NlpD
MRWSILAFALFLVSSVSMIAQGQHVDLALPTDNDALFGEGGAAFYQYIERDYKGEKSRPWQGGQYGFVRDPIETSAGIVYTRFHEGIDIKPMQRDAAGEPLDEVRAIADGKVVHINLAAGHSNYGRYVVIEHRWDGSPYYSLYGHLSSIGVKPGQSVRKGDAIAVMGYTGVGINRERAHVHLELNLMLSRAFEKWYKLYHAKDDPNYNGTYNGLNLVGLDIARLFLALRKNPSLTIPEFLGQEETFYKVTFPKSSHFDLPKLYPWMSNGGTEAKASWEVSFTRAGLPLRIDPSSKKVKQPEVTYVKKSPIDSIHLTHGDVAGRGSNAHLTGSGLIFMKLLIYPD